MFSFKLNPKTIHLLLNSIMDDEEIHKKKLEAIEARIEQLDKEIGYVDIEPFDVGYRDKTGKVVIYTDPWRNTFFFYEGLAHVEDYNCKHGFIDKTGIEVIPCQFDAARDFSEGLAAVMNSNKKWGYIDKTGEMVISYQWEDPGFFKKGLARVRGSNGKYGFIDKTGTVIIPCLWNDADNPDTDLIRVRNTSGKWGLIDKTGREVILCRWDDISPYFEDGLIKVKSATGLWGYIDINGRVIIPCHFEEAWDFHDGFASVVRNGKYCYINTIGKIVGCGIRP